MKFPGNIISALALSASLIIPQFPACAAGSEQRPGNSRQTSRHSVNNHRGNSSSFNSRPGNNTKPAGNTSRPGNSDNRPGNPGNRPGNSDNRPGNPGNRPGNPGIRPGGQSAPRPGSPAYNGPGISAPRPGSPSYVSPVRYPSRPAWDRPVPLRPAGWMIVPSAPAIPQILGLPFGSLINAGISILTQAGYSLQGYAADAVYLNNVYQFGFDWPVVSVYYGNAGMSQTRFQYSTPFPGTSRFNSVYSQLTARYGAPWSNTWNNGVNTVTWGASNGYVTLVYGPSADAYGNIIYYTDLIFGN